MDTEAFPIAHHKQRRVFQRYGVLLKLCISCGQVFLRPLIFPSEGATLPNISPSFGSGRFGGALLEAIALHIGSWVIRRRFAEQVTQIDEMSVGRLPLGQRVVAPFLNK